MFGNDMRESIRIFMNEYWYIKSEKAIVVGNKTYIFDLSSYFINSVYLDIAVSYR